MWINVAYAQGAAAPAGGSSDILMSLLPFLFIFIIMYVLILRPQQRRAKEMATMIAGLRRGDTVVTTGGLIGKISKVVDDNEIVVDFSENLKVRVLRQAVAEVRARGEPVRDA